jgi:hypothetical protein
VFMLDTVSFVANTTKRAVVHLPVDIAANIQLDYFKIYRYRFGTGLEQTLFQSVRLHRRDSTCAYQWFVYINSIQSEIDLTLGIRMFSRWPMQTD